jgi:hypothetical protein
MDSSYIDFLATHPLTFTEMTDPLEVDNWLCIIESNFGAWWANFTTTLLDDHQMLWAEFHEAFRGHRVPVGLMARQL